MGQTRQENKKRGELKRNKQYLVTHDFLYMKIYGQNIRNTEGLVKRLNARSTYKCQPHFYPPAKMENQPRLRSLGQNVCT